MQHGLRVFDYRSGINELNSILNLVSFSRMGMKIEVKMNTLSIGEAVRAQRKFLRMNQSDLAMVSGTGVRFISDLENGKDGCELGKSLQVLKNLGMRITLITQGER